MASTWCGDSLPRDPGLRGDGDPVSYLCLPSSVLGTPQLTETSGDLCSQKASHSKDCRFHAHRAGSQTLAASPGAKPSPLAPVVQGKPEVKTCVKYAKVLNVCPKSQTDKASGLEGKDGTVVSSHQFTAWGSGRMTIQMWVAQGLNQVQQSQPRGAHPRLGDKPFHIYSAHQGWHSAELSSCTASLIGLIGKSCQWPRFADEKAKAPRGNCSEFQPPGVGNISYLATGSQNPE